jgi:peptidoglycan/xylan/chitin deacetylase (PgdA/CDA1 family)
MLGRITFKRGIKRAAGWAAVASAPLTSAASGHAAAACILMYHRTARIDFVDPTTDDWNVHPDVFERQMRALSDCAETVPLEALAARLRDLDADPDPARPLVCVTFDDGYASVVERALPVLVRYRIPATFFVPTAYIGGDEPMPFDRWGQRHRRRVDADTWRPVAWRDLERALRTGLVSIGSHSHQHLAGRGCDAERLAEETARSRETLRARLGPEQARAYAYPYGCSRLGDVPAAYERAVRVAGYDLAVTTDLGLARAADNPLRLPRIEAHQVDTPSMLRAKMRGALGPYRVTDRLRGLVH